MSGRKWTLSACRPPARWSSPGRPRPHYARQVTLTALEESRVYDQFRTIPNLHTGLTGNAEAIVRYAFTEVLNNAIDHAQTERATINMRVEIGTVFFEIRDFGIGVFASIAAKLALDDEYAAMVELIKGKTTTMPEARSGEGIFFTSKIADRFVLRSHRIQLEWDRARDDAFVADVRHMRGTLVQFQLRRDARQSARTHLRTMISSFRKLKSA